MLSITTETLVQHFLKNSQVHLSVSSQTGFACITILPRGVFKITGYLMR